MSPAGVVRFVQVSVRKSVLPVQYRAYQLPPESEEKKQSKLRTD